MTYIQGTICCQTGDVSLIEANKPDKSKISANSEISLSATVKNAQLWKSQQNKNSGSNIRNSDFRLFRLNSKL